jgi:hypothetical protein
MNEAELKARVETLMQSAKQMEINLHAIGGAIQDCNYWLKRLEDENAANTFNDTQGVESQHQG